MSRVLYAFMSAQAQPLHARFAATNFSPPGSRQLDGVQRALDSPINRTPYCLPHLRFTPGNLGNMYPHHGISPSRHLGTVGTLDKRLLDWFSTDSGMT